MEYDELEKMKKDIDRSRKRRNEANRMKRKAAEASHQETPATIPRQPPSKLVTSPSQGSYDG